MTMQNGNNPIHFAARYGHEVAVLCLFEMGAKDEGKNVRQISISFLFCSILPLLSILFLYFLFVMSVYIFFQNNGRTPLDEAKDGNIALATNWNDIKAMVHLSHSLKHTLSFSLLFLSFLTFSISLFILSISLIFLLDIFKFFTSLTSFVYLSFSFFLLCAHFSFFLYSSAGFNISLIHLYNRAN